MTYWRIESARAKLGAELATSTVKKQRNFVHLVILGVVFGVVSSVHAQLDSYQKILTGDVNGDGRMDLIWNALGEDNIIHVALGQQDGSFTFRPAQVPPDKWWGGFVAFTGDVNGDGRMDLIWASPLTRSPVHIGLGKPDGTIFFPPEVCNDGKDNNSNGLIDEGCPEICNDGKDNNSNGLIDEGCPEICNDGKDNDRDGLIDEGCPEICNDGKDNDRDGLIDEGCSEICSDGKDNDRDGLIDEGCDPPPPQDWPMTICSTFPIPPGWIVVDKRWSPTSCGNPVNIVLNQYTIRRYDNQPLRAFMDVCLDSPTPVGWIETSRRWDVWLCGGSPDLRDVVKSIRRVN